MKKMLLVFNLAIAGGGGCTQDALDTNLNTTTMSSPTRISGDIPDIQAVILSPEESYREPGGAILRGSCDLDYVLQIRRISTLTPSTVPLRIFSKDADDEEFSAVINTVNLNAISNSIWVTVLLYDEDNNEICFNATDNLGFLQPYYFAEDVEFEVRLYNVSGTTNTTPETILWDANQNFYYTMYPAASGNCVNMNPSACCDFNMEAQSVASSVGTMRFVYPWDVTFFVYSVPPTGSGNYNATNCGAILSTWKAANHMTGNGFGQVEFTCDTTAYSWTIGDVDDIHGVLLDPNGRKCELEH